MSRVSIANGLRDLGNHVGGRGDQDLLFSAADHIDRLTRQLAVKKQAEDSAASASGFEQRIAQFLKHFRQGTFAEDHGTPGILYDDPSFRPGCWFDTESKALLAILSNTGRSIAAANRKELNEVIAACFWYTDFGHKVRTSWKLATIQAEERGPDSAAAEQVARYRSRALKFADELLSRLTFYLP